MVVIYKLTRLGLPETDLVTEFGISRRTWFVWKDKRKEIQEVIDMARREREQELDFPDYIYQKLSPELKELWDKIQCDEFEDDPVAKIESVLFGQGTLVRQRLFLHALCLSHFSPSSAMSKVNVSKKTVDKWIAQDPGFCELVEEIEYHKGNFFEEGLVKLVGQGVAAAVLFANRTHNASRGYGSKSTLEVKHSGAVLHGVLDLSKVAEYMSPTGRIELMDAIRKFEALEDKNTKQDAMPSLEARIAEYGIGVKVEDLEQEEDEA